MNNQDNFSWLHPRTIDELNQFNQGTMMEALGIEFNHISSNQLSATMPVDHRTVQPMRIMHGGAFIALAETLASVASLMMVNLKKQHVFGQNVSSNHIRSAKKGKVTGKTELIHLGKTTHIWRVDIFDEENRLCNQTTVTMFVKNI